MPRKFDEDGGGVRVAKKWSVRVIVLVALIGAAKFAIIGLVAINVLKR
jgi:hypothetical protein